MNNPIKLLIDMSKRKIDLKDNVQLDALFHKAALNNDKELIKKAFLKTKYLYYIIVVIVVSILTTIFGSILGDMNPILLSGLVFTFISLWIIEFYTRVELNKNFDGGLETILKRVKEYYEIDTKFENYLLSVEKYLNLLGYKNKTRDELKEIIEDLARNNSDFEREFKDAVHKEMMEIFLAFNELKEQKIHKDKYRTQFKFAEFFSNLADDRFWATSTDRVSIFQKKNYGYYEAMFRLAQRLINKESIKYESIEFPRYCRIFIGNLNTYANDVINDYNYLFELYKLHLRWGGSVNDNLYPIRFYIDENNKYEDLFKKYELNTFIIRDFMVIDNQMVYGREGLYADKDINLELSLDKDIINKYEKLYVELWRNSISLGDLIRKIFDDGYWIKDNKIKNNFLRITTNIESKLELIEDYKNLFIENRTEGEEFFNKVCEEISLSKNTIMAIDRANKKTDNIWRAWQNNDEYKAFYNSCNIAALNGVKVMRLFIIESELNKETKSEAIEFVKETIYAGWELRFIDSANIATIELEYLSDFLITGIKLEHLGNSSEEDSIRWQIQQQMNKWFGFELIGDQHFIKAGLTLNDNLIAKRLLFDRAKRFYNLWNNNMTIKLKNNSTDEINEFVETIYNLKGVQ